MTPAYEIITVASGGSAVVGLPAGSPATVDQQTVIVRLAGATGSYSFTGHILNGKLPPIRQAIGAEVWLVRTTTDGGVTWRVRGLQPGEPIGDWTLAEVLALNPTTYDGAVARVSGFLLDVGGTGSDARLLELAAINGRWRPRRPAALRRMLTSPAAVQSTSESIVQSVRIPAGVPKPGDDLVIRYGVTRTGSADAVNWRLRFGRLGTTGDASLIATSLSTSNGSSGGEIRLRVDSDLQVRLLGSGNAPAAFAGVNANAAPAGVAVSSLDGGDVYLSLGLSVQNVADSIQLTTFEVELETSP